MKATCTISRTPDGVWLARHESADLGEVEVRGSSSEEALKKMQRELQHRIELCPCSGVSGDTVEVELSSSSGKMGD
ncbi:hypothetical protein AYO47_02310 [Planctomyces sp. SCGC AG-212-M04]|nr:hypothetical protein AYO47_02310 [Planctomyces sp. SCGC AG-212-M04]